MAQTVAALVTELSANHAEFRRDMGKAADAVNSSRARINRELGKIDRGFGRLRKSVGRSIKSALGFRSIAAAAAGSAGLGLLIKSSLDAADAIAKIADKAGVATDFLQELRFAGSQTGVAGRDIDDAFTRLNRRLGLFVTNGGGPAAVGFKELGISARDAAGAVRSTESVFDEIVAKLETYENTAQQAAIASAFFGEDAGPRLVNLLSKGSAGVDELRRKARDLGIVLDEQLLRKSEQANDQLDALARTLKAQVLTAVIENADQIKDFATVLQDKLPGALRTTVTLVKELADNLALVGLVIAGFSGASAGARIGATFGPKGALVGGVAGAAAAVGSTFLAMEYLKSLTDAAEENIDVRVAEIQAKIAKLDRVSGVARANAQGQIKNLNAELETLKAAKEELSERAVLQPGGGTPTLAAITATPATDPGGNVIKGLRFELEQLHRTSQERELYNRLRQAGVAIGTEEGRQIKELVSDLQAKKAADQLAAEATRDHQAAIQETKREIESLVDATRTPLERFHKSFLDLTKLAGESPDVWKAAGRAMSQAAKEAAEWDKEIAAGGDDLQKFNAEIERLNDLVMRGRISWDDYRRSLRRAQDHFDEAAERSRELKRLSEELGNTLGGAFEDAILSGRKLGEVLRSLAQDIMGLIIRSQITAPLSDGLGDALGGVLRAILGGSTPALPAGSPTIPVKIERLPPIGPRARGGPVQANNLYLVGEEGKELFEPRTAGRVVPNSELGAGSIDVDINFVNQGTPKREVDRDVRFDGERWVLSLVADDIETGGKVAKAIDARQMAF